MRQVQRLKIAGPPVPFTGRLALSVGELEVASSVGRSSIYVAIAKGQLRSRMVGGRRVILVADALDWLEGKTVADAQGAAQVREDAGKPVMGAVEPAQDRADAPAGDAAATTAENADAGEGVRDGIPE